MYAITGITGKVGGEVARVLLEAGLQVRGVARDAKKAQKWASRGCEISVSSMAHAATLTAAFRGAKAVFVLPPPVFDPAPGYPEARACVDALATALLAAKPERVVSISTIGADADHDNLLSQHTLFETVLRSLGLPLTILRPAWYLENAAWDVASARETGVIHSFLQPLDKAFPMVATRDVARTAARLLEEEWTGLRVVELEGPTRVSPNDLAQAFAVVMRAPVRAVAVPRGTWEYLFRSQGMKNPIPRIRMLDGFNEGWIEFHDGGRSASRGPTPTSAVVEELVAAST